MSERKTDELAMAICHAVGVDPSTVTRVALDLRAGHAQVVTFDTSAWNADTSTFDTLTTKWQPIPEAEA